MKSTFGSFRLSILILFFLLFAGCAKLSDFIPISVDQTLGKQFSTQLNSNPPSGFILDPIKYKKSYEYLEKIKSNLLNSDAIKHKKDFEWELKIIKDDSTLNAFCVAGGYIYVYTGLINFLDSEAELAGVLAHEIAHADCRHTSMNLVTQYGTSFILSMVLGGDFSFLVGIGRELIGLSFSRKDEKQADEMAVRYLYDTEYDPKCVGGFFSKMISKNKDARVPEFLSTHPSSDTRIEDIHQKWKELGSKKGKLFENEYKIAKKNLNLAY